TQGNFLRCPTGWSRSDNGRLMPEFEFGSDFTQFESDFTKFRSGKTRASPKKSNSRPRNSNSGPRKTNSSPKKWNSRPRNSNSSPKKWNSGPRKPNSGPRNSPSRPRNSLFRTKKSAERFRGRDHLDGAEVLELWAQLVRRADGDDREALRIEVPLGEGEQLVPVDRGDPCQVGRVVVVGQVVDGEHLEPLGDVSDRLRGVGEDAGDVGPRLFELVGGDRLGADALDLLEDLAHRRAGRGGRHAGSDREGARAEPSGEPTRGAVGEAVALAQVQVDPARELAAEEGVEDEERHVVGIAPGEPGMADAQLRLGGPRPVDDVDRPGGARGRLDRRRGRGGGRGRAPERRFDPVGERLGIEIAGRDQDRAAEGVVVPVEAEEILALEPGDALARALERLGVGRAGVEHAREMVFGEGGGLVAPPVELGEAQLFQALDLALGEARRGRHLGEQLAGGPELAR